ncbi:lysophospholipid acyltransferase family protein [Pontibacter sp. G13]|uniref:lysophospholipid acyltransferase family protein n=1 Tax=Pontibacter sp. G13 TaxID=3074898 RepID=UPI00288965D8|nr:lysophospholipid acyltransferase family protein [Pontibacter sp. G13]WNJ17945.1 lysophospholipid acyltransferase family protein [Pontibacter sp. G13]
MKKLLGYVLTPLFLLGFGLVLGIFHPIQWICLKLGGYSWHKRSVDYLNWGLMRSLWVLGSHVRFSNPYDLPTDRPIIVVANHQSLFDIPPIFWHLRKHHVKFVSKKELAKGIPSISFNLKHGGNAIIDRKDSKQSLTELKRFAEYIEENNYCAAIFPEGTRSRTGKPKNFKQTGMKIMLKYAPSALIVPVAINRSWQLQRWGWYPMPVGVQPTWQVLEPIDPQGKSADAVIEEVEARVKSAIEGYKPQAEPV